MNYLKSPWYQWLLPNCILQLGKQGVICVSQLSQEAGVQFLPLK
jgi:hypothetical protein